MSKPETDQQHIRYCMLMFFNMGWHITKATKAINDAYGEVLPLWTCRFWFSKFKSGNRNLKDTLELENLQISMMTC